MITAEISPEIWKHIGITVETVATEIHLKFKPDGLSVAQVTSDKSAMVGLELPASEFLKYQVEEEQLIILNLDNLSKINKRMSGVTMVGLARDDAIFQMTLYKEKHERTFEVPILMQADDYKEKPIPYDLVFDSEFRMTADTFISVIKDIEIISARTLIVVEDDKLVIRGSGDAGASVKAVLEEGDELIQLIKSGEGVLSASYSTPRLKALSDALIDKKGTVLAKMTNNKPLWLEISLSDNGRIVLLIAPVVERR